MTLRVSSRSSAADFAAPSVTAARRGRGEYAVREIEGAKAAAEPMRVARNAIFMVVVVVWEARSGGKCFGC